MAKPIQSGNKTRFTDLYNEPVDHLLSPIKGYQDKPLVSLMEAIEPVSKVFNEIEDNVLVALHNCQSPADGLNQQESASIHLYTMEFDSGLSLYVVLNESLRAENRGDLKPWFSYLKLFLTALHKLPSQSRRVWRGIRDVDLSSKYKTGTKFAWWGVSSCTADMQLLESEKFLGKHGQRTLFSIECINGKSVSAHSYFKNTENEIILMPGSYFEVLGQLNPAPELHIIELKEITPPMTLVKPPFSKSDEQKPSMVVNEPNTLSQSTSIEMTPMQPVNIVTNQISAMTSEMAQPPIPMVSFHQKTFGKNIQLDNNALRATRHTSYDDGITFTNRQIEMNEYIHIRIDSNESRILMGSLAIGFTQIDPNTIQIHELCKSAVPNICQKTGLSYVKRIFDKLTNQTVISFYYNQEGAFYIFNGREHEISRTIDSRMPLWGIIDVYANVKSVVLTTPPKRILDARTFFIKYESQPHNLSIRYFTHLQPTNLQPIVFHDVHGPELELYCENKVVFRKNVRKLTRPYLFINFPIKPGDEFYIRILSIDFNYGTPGIIGFTNSKLSHILANFDKLPADDPMDLYNRREFWIINKDGFDERLSELDEYRFVYDQSGDIYMCRNNESILPTRTVAHIDPSQEFYPFFFLNGRIAAFSLMGLVSPTRIVPHSLTLINDRNDDFGICQLCCDAPANCVMFPCGHVFFCSNYWSLISLLSSSIEQCKSIEFIPLTSTDEYKVHCYCENIYLCYSLIFSHNYQQYKQLQRIYFYH
ncbi:unnamed protein product [Rotaria sordida]|uniref:NAD(P)(+)--arginine ADP-ribosyltransferase n=2 Tax=Rotaria sordida TaxID=392033 RepID=A0A814JAH5_9BILA|nr:unnamed protein product [Rotaria sordida]